MPIIRLDAVGRRYTPTTVEPAPPEMVSRAYADAALRIAIDRWRREQERLIDAIDAAESL